MDNGISYAAAVTGPIMSQPDSRTAVVALQTDVPIPNGSSVTFQRTSDGTVAGTAVIVSQVAGQGLQTTFTFDRDLPSRIVGAVMYGNDPSQRGGNAVIERNAVEESAACCRGLLIAGLLNSSVRGNYIQRSPLSALEVEHALYPAFLSPPAASLGISGNVIDMANWTAVNFNTYQLSSIEVIAEQSNGALLASSPNQNVAITGNFIADSGSAAVWLGNTNGGSVSGNYFLNPNNNAAVVASLAAFGPSQPLVTQASQNLNTSGNTVDQTSGRMWITDTQYRELAAYAPGSAIRVNAYELGTFLPGPTVTLTDADGNTTPVAIQSTTAHAIDVQIPLSGGLGGAYLTLTAGSSKYFGTLFLDSVDNSPALNGCTYELSPASKSVGPVPATCRFWL
jgi:hypothetical protein